MDVRPLAILRATALQAIQRHSALASEDEDIARELEDLRRVVAAVDRALALVDAIRAGASPPLGALNEVVRGLVCAIVPRSRRAAVRAFAEQVVDWGAGLTRGELN